MTDLLKKAVPAVALAVCASWAFAGTPGVKYQNTSAYGSTDTVSQTEPAPDCKKKPTDPRCKDKK